MALPLVDVILIILGIAAFFLGYFQGAVRQVIGLLAWLGSFLIALGFFVARRTGFAVESHVALLATIGITSVVWIATTFLTKPRRLNRSARA